MSAFAGYDYNPSTGTYTKNPNHNRRPSGPPPQATAPPPRPPKEPDVCDIIKETHHAQPAELDSNDGDNGVPRFSLDSQPRTEYYATQPAPPPSGRKVRILSLDGGGIRGYSTLVILQDLMHQVYVRSHGGRAPKSPADLPRPCDYFDLIGGNGTGGLIALMLGRMRMNVETCKETYVNLTRFVFITDKTLLGMPYGKTLFKASRLEEAIKYCVESATRYEETKIIPGSPPPMDNSPFRPPVHRRSDSWRRNRRESHASSGSRPGTARRRGNPEASLSDTRDGTCKTFVTAMLKGSRKGTSPVLLRSYPSPAESVPSYRVTIWEAGRATCATAQAFKPVTIDQTTFLDEGAGQYNPAFSVLDEAREYEFPDAHVAAFISIGTGKRQGALMGNESKKEWWEGVAFEEFAEAKRRLMRRTDDAERVHRELVDGIDGGRPRLAKSGVAVEDYYRFNVEVGVGEFGMNEWNRLAEVATGTRRYLAQREASRLVRECAAKLVDAVKPNFNARPRGPSIQSSPPVLPYRPTSPPQQQQQYRPETPPKPQYKPEKYRPASPPQQQQYQPNPPPPPPPPPPQEYRPNPARPASPPQQPPYPTANTQHPYPTLPNPYKYASPPDEKEVVAAHPPAPPPQIYQPAPAIAVQKPTKEGKVILPYGEDTPEIRATSPTTVAGDSGDEEEAQNSRRRRRRRRGSRSRSRSGASGLDEIGE